MGGGSRRDSQSSDGSDSPQKTHYYHPARGTVLKDRYRIEGALGHGRFSKCFAVTDLTSGERRALKVYRASSEFYEYFCNEKKILDAFKGDTHPNVIQAFDRFEVEEDDSTHGAIVYDIMEGDVKKALKGTDGFSIEDTRKVFVQVARGLQFLSDHGIVHADLKPENVLINKDMSVKICDVGSGMLVHEIDSFRVGTVAYQAPELIIGLPYNTKIDVWSLGCLMFELLTDECVFDPEMYFASDAETESEGDVNEEGGKVEDGEAGEGPDDDSTIGEMDCTSETDSDEEFVEGYEWELNHFQLSAMRCLIGRVPVEVYGNAKFFPYFFNSKGRLRAMPRNIDDRNIREILVEEFKKDEQVAEQVRRDMMMALVYDPALRPTAGEMADHMETTYVEKTSRPRGRRGAK
ncbi:g9418 [Coccomyxa viridis]|uniref:G9418 protein n=1 Tax=Coccomyxa viridis TaxID=1274662 RepID=A0ABP1G7Q0_9CHLO